MGLHASNHPDRLAQEKWAQAPPGVPPFYGENMGTPLKLEERFLRKAAERASRDIKTHESVIAD